MERCRSHNHKLLNACSPCGLLLCSCLILHADNSTLDRRVDLGNLDRYILEIGDGLSFKFVAFS